MPGTPGNSRHGEASASQGGRRTEVRDRRSEIGDRRSEIGDRRSEIGDRRSEIGGRRSEVGRHRTAVRDQITEPSANPQSWFAPTGGCSAMFSAQLKRDLERLREGRTLRAERANRPDVLQRIPIASTRERLGDQRGRAEASCQLENRIVFEMKSHFARRRAVSKMRTNRLLNRAVKLRQAPCLSRDTTARWIVP